MYIFKRIILATVLIAVGFGFSKLLTIALEKEEIVSCLKLQEYSEEFSNTFYITVWQNQTCSEHGINIDAPVYKPEE